MQSAVRVDPGGWQLTEHTVRTDVLEICYEAGGPEDGPPVLLIHGWPDAPRGWHEVAARLQAAGWRTIAPYLRAHSAPSGDSSSKVATLVAT